MEKPKIEKYIDSYNLRAITSTIPYIGGALDILLSVKGEKLREKRINELFTQINSRLEKIEEKESLQEYLNTEEFYDLFVKVLNSVIRTRHLDKIKGYASILVNHLSVLNSKKEDSELMVTILDSIVLEELEYLSDLHNNSDNVVIYTIYGIYITAEGLENCIKETKQAPNNADQIPEKYHFKNNRMIIWKFLSDKNLIEIEKNEEFGTLPYIISSGTTISGATNYREKNTLKISEFGHEFINWIIKE